MLHTYMYIQTIVDINIDMIVTICFFAYLNNHKYINIFIDIIINI